jgi:hexosaminidase
LAKVTEPFGISYRQQLRTETQLTPLTQMSDAVIPDPPFRRNFAGLIEQLLSDAPNFSAKWDELAQKFKEWHDLLPAFQAIEDRAPMLANCESRVRDLRNLGATGLEALTYLQSRTAPPSGWKEAQLALIGEAEKPDPSLLKLSWLASYRALILAASDVDGLKTATPQQWKQQVMQEAIRQEPRIKYTW